MNTTNDTSVSTSTTSPKIDPLVKIKDLSEKSILIWVTIGMFNGTRKDKQKSDELCIENNANKANARVIKSLLKSEQLSEVLNCQAKIRNTLYKLSAPWNTNERIIKISNYIDVKLQLEELRREFYSAAANVVANYQQLIKTDKENLGDLFNPDDYPSPESFAKSFYVKIDVKPVEKNDFRCNSLSDREVNDINEQILARANNAVKEANRDLVNRLKDSVRHLVVRLDSDGKLHKSAFDNVVETINNIRNLNIVDDEELTKLFDSVEQRVSNYNAAQVRDNNTQRSAASKDMKAALADIEKTMKAFGY